MNTMGAANALRGQGLFRNVSLRLPADLVELARPGVETISSARLAPSVARR